jgi:hypothetical protein
VHCCLIFLGEVEAELWTHDEPAESQTLVTSPEKMSLQRLLQGMMATMSWLLISL